MSDSINEVFLNACINNDIELVKKMIKQGVDIHAENDRAISRAACCLNFDIVKLLVENGVDPNTEDIEGSVLYWAAFSGDVNAVKFLVEHGADINIEYGMALYPATMYGHMDVIKYLLDNGLIVTDDNHQVDEDMIDEDTIKEINSIISAAKEKQQRKV